MNKRSGYDRTKKVIIGLVDVIIYHVAIYVSFFVRYQGNIPYNYAAYEESWIYIMAAFLLLNILFGVYILYNKSRIDMLYITIIIQAIMSIAIMAVTFFGRWFTFPRSIVLISFITSTIFLYVWRLLVFRVYERIDGTKKVMVVGSEEACRNAIYNFSQSKNHRHKISHVVLSNYFENIQQRMNEIDIVYLADQMEEEEKRRIYELLIKNDKKLFLNTNFENLVLVNPNIMNIEDESIIEVSHFRIRPEDDVVKRLLDIIFSLAMIVLTSPIMLIAAVLVKVTSEGPVLYKQVRITKDNKEFNILKFRTMSATAEKDSGPVLASANDARVTTVGKYFRSLRIDELPQLFNVLTGDMSLVGPRPERPYFVEQFKELNPYYYLRHNVRAGITGYAQVYGKYASNFNSKLNFDLVYIKKYSIMLDIKIMLQTIKTLFDKVSSQGVDEDVDVMAQEIPADIQVVE